MILLELFNNISEYTGKPINFSESIVDSLFYLEFEDSGLELKNIIETVYTSGIDGFEDVENDGTKITGVFIDRVSSGLTKRFRFTVTEDNISYKLLNPEDLDNLDDADFAELEFATTPTGKKKKCVKGEECGGTCINRDKVCNKHPSKVTEGKIKNLLAKPARNNKKETKTNKTTERPKKEKVAKAESAKTEIKETQFKSKKEPEVIENKNIEITQGKKTEFARKWESSWSEAPDDLKTLLKILDEPDEVTNSIKGTAYYSGGKIFMDTYTDNNNARDRSVYSHEYGHYIDDSLPVLIGARKLENRLKELKLPNLKELERLNNSDDDSDIDKFVDIRNEIKKSYGVSEGIVTLNDIKRLASGYTLGSKKFISSSKEGTEAFAEDNDRLLRMSTKNNKEKDLAAYENKYNLYKNDIAIELLGTRDPEMVGREIRRMDLIRSTQEVAEKLALEELRTKNKRLKKLDTSYGSKHNGVVEKYVRQELLKQLGDTKTSLDGKAIKALQDTMKVSTLYKAVVSGINDPDVIASATEDYAEAKGKNSQGLVQDLIGSITKNKVGKGHSTDYYNDAGKQETEAFANIIAMHRLNDPVINSVIDYLAPNGYNFVKKVINDANNNGK